MSSGSNLEPSCVRHVLAYFLQNPAAADSLEGIARQRVEQIIQQTVLETDEALRWLVARGFVVEDQRLYSGRIFSLNPEKQAEAETFFALRDQNVPPR